MKNNMMFQRRTCDQIIFPTKKVNENDIDIEIKCKCCGKKGKTTIVCGAELVKCPNCGCGHNISEFE